MPHAEAAAQQETVAIKKFKREHKRATPGRGRPFSLINSEKFNKIINYHEATKHHYDRYARSPGYMDWKNQPNPFRTYSGSPVHPLKLLKQDPPGAYLDLYDRKNNLQRPFTIETIAGFLELSLGLSA